MVFPFSCNARLDHTLGSNRHICDAFCEYELAFVLHASMLALVFLEFVFLGLAGR